MSSRGVAGTTKPRSHNVNSVYSGRSNASGRAAGPLKHGIQPIGKSAGIIRRMPPPATLPSLKAEHGQDVSVSLVPQGGQGWNKTVDANADSKAAGSPDLRPNWAKSVAGGNPAPNAEAAGNSAVAAAPQPQRQKNAVNNSREFPPLAATVTATTKQPLNSATPTAEKSQRVQNVSEPVPVIPVPPPPSSGSGYIGASSSARNNVDRMLPERYYGGGQEIRQTTQRRYDFRQKMAQLSMESKEAASQQMEKPPQEVEPIVETEVPPATSVPIAQPQNPSPLPSPTPTSASARRVPNETRSQDVRMYYQPSSLSSTTAQDAPVEPETNWNRSGSSYDGDYLGGSRANDFSNSGGYHPPQPLHGRVESGGSFGNMGAPIRMPSRTGIPPLRYENEVEPNAIHPQNFGSWEDPYNAQWGADPYRFGTGTTRLSQRSRGAYRGDSRGNSESESGWYPPPPQRRNDPNGWGYPMDPQMARYDGYPTGRGSNRSRTTSNSYPDDFDPAMYVYSENDRRVKRRPEEELRYENELAEGYDRQKQYYHGGPPQQQQPYRMLRRNDEKSAEYFETGSLPFEEEPAEEGPRMGRPPRMPFERPVEVDRPTSYDEPNRTAPSFNKAPGSGKPSRSKTAEETKKAVTPPDNVWKKRMEESQQPKEEKQTWQNAKTHRRQENEFPLLAEKIEDPNKSKQIQRQAQQSAVLSGWEEQSTGVEWGADEYEGDRREFFNRQRSQRSSTNAGKAAAAAKARPDANAAQRRAAANGKPRKRNDPEDTFSNMGEFHVEDYKGENRDAEYANGAAESGDTEQPRNGGRRGGQRRNVQTDEASGGNPQSKGQRTRGGRQRKPNNEEGGAEALGVEQANVQRRSSQRTQKPRNNKTAQPAVQPVGNGKVKSPARPENGVEEWETASESSDVNNRKSSAGYVIVVHQSNFRNEKLPNNRPQRQNAPKQEAENGSAQSRPNPKNAKPASHISQNNVAFAKSSSAHSEPLKKKSNNKEAANSDQRHQTNARTRRSSFQRSAREDGGRKSGRNGLAGSNANDASVTAETADIHSSSEQGFEEVLSRKARRQKQHQQQQEEEKIARERQRAETNARKQKQREERKSRPIEPKVWEASRAPNGNSSDTSAKPASSSLSPLSDSEAHAAPVVCDPSPWNNTKPKGATAHIPSLLSESECRPIIPSPIARPTKNRREPEVVETFVKTEESEYTFQYESKTSDDDIKEKMNKIKTFWPGEETNTSLIREAAFTENGVKSGNDHSVSRAEVHSSVSRQISNPQSPINATIFGSHANSLFPLNSAHYGPPPPFMMAPNNGREMSRHPSSRRANSPAALVAQNFAANRAPYFEPTYISNSNGNANDWSMDVINSSSSMHMGQFNGLQTNTTAASNRYQAPPPQQFQPLPQPLGPIGMPPPRLMSAPAMNPNVPPPPIGMPPPLFSFPPPGVGAQHQNFAVNSLRNLPPPLNNPIGTKSNAQRRPSHNGGRQNASPNSPTWTGFMKPSQPFGLF